MTNSNSLILADDLLATSGLSENLLSRCLALNLTHSHILAVSQLDALYNCPAEEIVVHVENGISLPKVAEALRLRQELQELEGTTVETVNEYVELIDFHTANEVDDFATNDNKRLYNGRALTQEQREDILIQQIIGDADKVQSAPINSIVENPHNKIIETLLEGIDGTLAESDDPAKELLEKIKAEMNGDVLQAYHLCVDQRDRFHLFLEGKIDLHHLRHEDHNPGEDQMLNEEI